jgi:threonine dehydrogenase-like Zn-dependent dehydrogenase
MKTTAIQFYGKKQLRMATFELPPIKEDELLAEVITDTICMSSYKAVIQGSDHKRVPNDIDKNPVMLGHELCGNILEVGAKWKRRYRPGDRFTIQPAMFNASDPYAAAGYSFPYFGGDATRIIIPGVVMENDCVLEFNADAYFYGSLAEPISCIIGAYHAAYHTSGGCYVHDMDIVNGGRMALLAGGGPMGLGCIDLALGRDRRPSLLVVTDIDANRLARAKRIYSAEYARQRGVELIYVNTEDIADVPPYLKGLNNGKGFDDVFAFTPVTEVLEQASNILGQDGCLNFFAGPINTDFSANLNYYNVHYSAAHVMGTTGGNTEDMKEGIRLCEQGRINPASMITHVGGLDCVIETTLNLPNLTGCKKLIYPHISMPLTAIDDFDRLGASDPVLAELARIVANSNGLWCTEAEKYLLAHGRSIEE